MRQAPGLTIEKLHSGLDTHAFDCGKSELNRYLQIFALMNQKANSAQTYAAHRDGIVVGYYSLPSVPSNIRTRRDESQKGWPGIPSR